MTQSAMAEPRFVAVLDVGKTNVKVVLHDLDTGQDLAVRTTPNVVRQSGPYPHFDAAAIQAFFLDGLADMLRQPPGRIDGISITCHGASGALLGPDGLALPVLDYEHKAIGDSREAYERIRPDFAETFSPGLPHGLNLGAQIFWQQCYFPDAFERVRAIVTYPQYWAWWMTGVSANEATSLGAHTDLWNPKARTFSSLIGRAGWGGRMAPIRSAFDRLGMFRPELAGRLGLAAVPVACGIHDSNASLLPHLLGDGEPPAVVSTGTWIIVFACGGSVDKLDPRRDMLANVDAFARPVPSARFMGGREFDLLTGGTAEPPDAASLGRVIERGIMALPTFAPGNGPFPEGHGRWSHPAESLSRAERSAVASLYAGLMTCACLDSLQAQGPIVVEGPFARNTLYLDVLAARTGRAVRRSTSLTGTSGGAAHLARERPATCAAQQAAASVPHTPQHRLGPAFDIYARDWLRAAQGYAP